MSLHDMAILMGIFILTICAGALFGYVIDRVRK